MIQKKVLIVNWGTDDKKYVFEAGKRKGLDLYLATNRDYPKWILDYISHEKIILTNVYDSKKLIKDVVGFMNKDEFQFDGVTTFFEMNVMQTAKLAEKINLRFIPYKIVEVSSANKWKMRKVGKKFNLPSPKWDVFEGIDEGKNKLRKFNLPVIIKPIMSGHSYGVIKVNHKDEFEKKFRDAKKQLNARFDEWMKYFGIFYSKKFLIEEFIDGEMLSVDGIIADGEEKFIGVSSFEMSPEPAMMEVATFIPTWMDKKRKKKCIEVTRKIYKSLGFDNCGFHCEMKWHMNRGPVLIEIAARLPGGQMLDGYKEAYGVDLAGMYFDLTVGSKIRKWVEKKNKKWILQESIPLQKEGKISRITGADRLNLSNTTIYQMCKRGEIVKNYGGIFLPKIYYSVMADTKVEIKKIRKIAMEIEIKYDDLFYFLNKAKSIIKSVKRKLMAGF